MNGQNNPSAVWVTERFISAAPQAAAKALAGLATHEALLLLKPLKSEYVVLCLNPMEPAKAAALLRRMPSRQTAHILSKLELKQAARVYQAFSEPQKEKIKTILPESFRSALQEAQLWPRGSAGEKMNRDFLIFGTEAHLSDIVDKLKTLPRKKLPAACLVMLKDGKVKGFIRTAELAFYSPQSTAGSVMTEAESLPARAPAEDARKIVENGQPLVPVTDENGRPLGVLCAQNSSENAPRKKRFGWFF